jgi:RNA recognition motif-containing protein
MSVRLFVGNLSYDTTEAELKELFSEVGPVSFIRLPMDRETGRPRGFAFVELSEREHAEEAIRRFNNQIFKGRPLAVNEARAKEEGGSRPPYRPSAPSQASQPHIPSPDMFSLEAPTRKRDFDSDNPARRDKKQQKGKTQKQERSRGSGRKGKLSYDEDDY